MEITVVDEKDLQKIWDKLEEIIKIVQDEKLKGQKGLSEKWLDNQNVCLELNISKRTLQYYRDNSTLPFTKVGNKVYYKKTDVEKLLQENYNG